LKGLSQAMDRWVLHHAIENIAQNSHTKNVTNICLHLSNEILLQKNSASLIANMLKNSQLRGFNRLIFHVDENWFEIHKAEGEKFLKDMHSLSCGLLLNNYGSTSAREELLKTGGFNFAQLSSKLTKGIVNNKEKQQKLSALISKANDYECTVIASQIEDPQSLSLLWQLGVRLFQGHFIQEAATGLDYDFSQGIG